MKKTELYVFFVMLCILLFWSLSLCIANAEDVKHTISEKNPAGYVEGASIKPNYAIGAVLVKDGNDYIIIKHKKQDTYAKCELPYTLKYESINSDSNRSYNDDTAEHSVIKVDYYLLIELLSKIFQFDYSVNTDNGDVKLWDKNVSVHLTIGSKDMQVMLKIITDVSSSVDDGELEKPSVENQSIRNIKLPMEVAFYEGVLSIPAISLCTEAFNIISGNESGYMYLAYDELKLSSGAISNG